MSRPQSTPTQNPTCVVVRLPCPAIASPSKYGRELRFRAPAFLSHAAAAALRLNEFRLTEMRRKPVVELHSSKAEPIVPAPTTDAQRGESVRIRARTVELSQHDCAPSQEEIPSNFVRGFNEAEQTPDSRPVRLTVIYPVLH